MAHVIVLAGGGTGGHVFPALALADAIRADSPDIQVRFIATDRGIGTHHQRAAGYEVDVVPSAPLVGRGIWGKLRALWIALRGTWEARRVLQRTKADLVIGVGGYASVPAVAAALTMHIPTAVLEADAEPGLANRMLGRYVGRVFVQFDDARASFPPGRAERLGFPVRAIPPHEDAKKEGLRLLVLGGSQGAHSLNRTLCDSLSSLRELGVRITHQTGAADRDEVRQAYAAAGVDAEVDAFFNDVPARLARTDLVVGRAGASSVAEFCAAGVAQVLVPYPFSAGGHQMHNARELERAGACVVIPDREIGERLLPELAALTRDRERRSRMAAAAKRRAAPDAAADIWHACRALPGKAKA